MLQKSSPTQDSASILLQRKMIENASYAHVAANKINNDQKVMADYVLGLSSDEEIDDEERVFCCASCPRKFSSQQAMAGHRNTHRSEWDYRSTVSNNTSSTIPMPSLGAPQYPLAKPSNVLKGSPICVSRYPLADRGNTFKVPSSTCVPRYSMVKANPTIAHKGPTPGYCGALKGPIAGYPLAKANPTIALKGPTTGYPLIRANPTIAHKGPIPGYCGALKGPIAGYPLAKANPIITLKGLTTGYPLAKTNPTIALKGEHPMDKANPTNALEWPSPRYSMVKAIPTKTLKKASPRHLLSNPTNSPIGPSLGVAHYTFIPMTKTLNMPLVCEQNHPLEKCAKPHGKSTLGVRCESMIHKPCQGKLGQQLIGGKIRHFGINNNNVGLKSLSISTVKSLLTSTGSTSTPESRGSNEAHDLLSSSFQPINDNGKKGQGFFVPTSTHERQNHEVHNSSQGLVMQWDNNEENDSLLDVDLDLKL
ncbi:hypothetical protein L6452_16315 [Arctium lappa]|uniref:Uncharacterized protein n=1 Tax=Arctium lappa TaxID=4217 RepID=A0ACB9C075_ARCLA|nr:hypothetical protein L6452_16315 [Arctium lappa]